MGHRRTRRTRKTRRTKNKRYRRQKGGENLSPSNENENKKDSGIFGKVSEWLENPNWIPDSSTSSTPSTSSQNAGRRRRRRKHRRTYKK
jgi:hypothetical protein